MCVNFGGRGWLLGRSVEQLLRLMILINSIRQEKPVRLDHTLLINAGTSRDF